MPARTFQFALVGILLAIVTTPMKNATGKQFLSKDQDSQEENLKLTARYHIERGTDKGFLIVKAEIPKDSYIYGLSQKSPLIPSKLVFKSDPRIKVTGKFKTDRKPTVIEKDPVFETRLEKHTGTIQFFVPIKVASTNELKSFKPTVLYTGQVCSKQGFCRPINKQPVQAVFAGFFDREAKNSSPAKREK